MHHMDSKKILGEKAKLEINKDAACCSEKILEVVLHKTVATWPFTSHLINHPSKMNMTAVKVGMTPIYGHTSVN